MSSEAIILDLRPTTEFNRESSESSVGRFPHLLTIEGRSREAIGSAPCEHAPLWCRVPEWSLVCPCRLRSGLGTIVQRADVRQDSEQVRAQWRRRRADYRSRNFAHGCRGSGRSSCLALIGRLSTLSMMIPVECPAIMGILVDHQKLAYAYPAVRFPEDPPPNGGIVSVSYRGGRHKAYRMATSHMKLSPPCRGEPASSGMKGSTGFA